MHQRNGFDRALSGCGLFTAGIQLIGTLGCLGLALLFIVGPIMCPRQNSRESLLDEAELTAYVWAQLEIQSKLKAPSTARFPARNEPGVSITRNGNIYKIYSFVDSKNSFGATIRSKWIAKVECAPGDKAASVIYAEIKR